MLYITLSMQTPPTKRQLAPAEIERLQKLCGLFSSHHAPERASAAAMADRFLRERGLRWPDVLGAPATGAAPTPGDDDPLDRWPGGWRGAAVFCVRHADLLTGWEASFADCVAGWRGQVSEKQRDVLRRLLDRVLRACTT